MQDLTKETQNEMKPPVAGGEAADYADFWHECRSLHAGEGDEGEEEEAFVKTSEEEVEPEPEEEWLQAVGLGDLAATFRSGNEVEESEVAPLVATLPRRHARTVFRRVAALNATVKRRQHLRQKPPKSKPDIRQVFGESSPSSSSPELLAPSGSSPPRGQSVSPPSSPDGVPRFVSIFRGTEQDTQSRSNRPKTSGKSGPAWMGGPGGDVASDSGIQMLGYHNFGTIYMPGYIPRASRGSREEVNHSESSQEGDNDHNHNNRGFEAVLRDTQPDDEEDDSIDVPVDPCGRTYLSDLSEEDANRLRKLLLMELTALCDEEGLAVSRRKPRRRAKRESESGIFGVSLTRLVDRDQAHIPDCRVPIILQKLLNHLEHSCLEEEGLLRVAGHRQKTQTLRQTLEDCLYSSPEKVEEALSQASPHDVAGVLKQFLRDLPEPLLPSSLRETFLQVPSLKSPTTQLRALNLLVLLLPQAHRDTLAALLTFLGKLASRSEANRMPLRNISMIMAPTLFLPSASKSLDSHLNVAAITCRLSEMLVLHQERLWTVPPYLLRQARRLREDESNKKHHRPIRRLLPRKTGRDKDYTQLPPHTDAESLIVSAPQLGLPDHPMPFTTKTTAGDVVWSLMTQCLLKADAGSEPPNRRQLAQLAPDGSLGCLLNASDMEDALATHSLCEVGGNIGSRRLEATANLAAVLEVNSGASWELRCHHRGASR